MTKERYLFCRDALFFFFSFFFLTLALSHVPQSKKPSDLCVCRCQV